MSVYDDAQDAPPFDVPAVQTYGAAYKLNVQTDGRGAVLVAYTRDAETGAVTRSQIRVDLAGVDYIKRRLSGG
ncbi:hypothetical protein [Streptomyces sp. NRRL F-2747]|uniref:hypothetical protein n=1 Tax=Streptomyces sp. NRRL F-2747 TaxID=1463843 RepID=UPI0004CABD2F|nr:hypothetical protein [Streptomyces sp. NRRL F-2747]